MLKKSLIILSIFCLIILSSSAVLAGNIADNIGNATQNTARGIGNGIQDLVDGAGNVMQNVGNGISNMMSNTDNDVTNMDDNMDNTENTDMSDDNSNGNDEMTNDNLGGTMEGSTPDSYTAARTSDVQNTLNVDHTIVWVVLAVAAAIIIALVWYYATQTNDINNNR